ncbi:hypothetical protein [Planctomicrobium piriforme]|uniref:hypothetical protein n=1 Tax=Planctomicrobium piriforme TaxID=1576369 RepID=UPI00111390EA|nr:hypothetical protein [Planctomicrobium piriforme]
MNSAAVRPLWSRSLLVLLCLVSWRGPVPCLHAHATEGGANVQLEHHLHAYHEDQRDNRFLTWHLHFLLPWERFDPLDAPQESVPCQDPLTHEGAVVTVLSYCEMQTHLADAWLDVFRLDGSLLSQVNSPTVAGQCTAPWFGSFSESLLLSAPLCAVTGEMLC